MSKISAREVALTVLCAVENEGAYANLALNRALGKYRLEKLERAFATELVYGALRHRGTVDWVLGGLLKKPLRSHTVLLRNILRLGAYQLLYLDRVPPSAACNEGAEMARRHGHKGAVKLVNGVLRNVARMEREIEYPPMEEDPVVHIAVRYSHPEWLVRDWLERFERERVIAICRANNEAWPVTVRTNALMLTREELADALRKEGLRAAETVYAPEGLRIEGYGAIDSLAAFRSGWFQVQDESSMLAARALCPEPGARVLDVCSAPGGKTTHLAELMGNTGEIIALDLYPHKIALVEENCRRLRIETVRTMVRDATELPGELKEWADYLLVDVPCSGLGVLRRRPDARWRKEPEQMPPLVELQRRILTGAGACLRPGGVLVYSTCTLNHEENLGQVRDFLSTHPEFTPEDLSPYLPDTLERIGQGSLQSGHIQILPGEHGLDGFFISRMRKRK